MTLFEMTYNEGDEIFAMSLVENPAIEEEFLLLSTEKEELKLSAYDTDQRLIVGAALVPNKPIYRKDEDGREYYIYFSEETVAKAARDFVKNGNQTNFTLEHSQNIEGVSVVESWLVEDEDKDKSRKYGLNVPKGTWMLTSYVEDEKLWAEQLRGNKVFGYSLEGKFGSEARRELSDQHLDSIVDNIKATVKEYINA